MFQLMFLGIKIYISGNKRSLQMMVEETTASQWAYLFCLLSIYLSVRGS